jgi:hypothetical protein
VVVVPPDEVKTCETSGGVWRVRVTGCSHEGTDGDETDDGVAVNDEAETDETE